MPRPCTCDKCEIGKNYTKEQCRRCWLYHNKPQYKKMWDKPAPVKKAETKPAAAPKAKRPCGCRKKQNNQVAKKDVEQK